MLEILNALMQKHGDDAYSLQAKSSVPQPTTQRFLSGKHGEPRSSTVKKWALAYGLTESQLRGDVPLPTEIMTKGQVLYPSEMPVEASKVKENNSLYSIDVSKDRYLEVIMYCYSKLSDEHKDVLATMANKLLEIDRPDDAKANPNNYNRRKSDKAEKKVIADK